MARMQGIRPGPLLTLPIGLSGAVLALQFVAYRAGVPLEPQAFQFWSVLFSILSAMWVLADSYSFPRIYRPFEFGWLVLLAAPFYAIYYLVKTRGPLGILWVLGYLTLYVSGVVVEALLWYR